MQHSDNARERAVASPWDGAAALLQRNQLTLHTAGECRGLGRLDVRNARVLVVRMSGNWDDGGNLANDMGGLGEVRLIGKSV
ncbi:MAG: hypothetical protein NTW28_26100 [Candidatus Solibacter sp.]|nr:hypothetical protein [Candidatus Solibacter sp.]